MEAGNLSEKMSLQINAAVRNLLSQQDTDPYSPTRGCFDRRYWAWKLVDYPEATYQRNVQPLAELWADPKSRFHKAPEVLDAVLGGLEYSTSIQHSDGSFDQAFPQEHSFTATAFLLHSLLAAFSLVYQHMDSSLRIRVEDSLRRATVFICEHDERHGHIANHLAGAVLALLCSAEYFDEERFRSRAEAILEGILRHQSSEGWFLEYEGADPGYQTLCLYYLAQVYEKTPGDPLRKALDRAIRFIAHFVHPDGTFAGEYGSRRTAVFYPGGLALLSQEFSMARSITQAMCRSICAGDTVSLGEIDMGNMAPLLSNYISALQTEICAEEGSTPGLPWEQLKLRENFPEAGLYIRGTDKYYSILGVSNGGVLKIFDKSRRRVLWNDGGYVGKLKNGTLVTTQITSSDRPCVVNEVEISLTSSFYRVLHLSPTPLRFILLRLLNLTLMRSVRLGNVIKKGLVRLMISGKHPCSIKLERKVRFEDKRVIVEDLISKSPRLRIEWLEFGHKFIGIHMASAGYFEKSQVKRLFSPPKIDVVRLNEEQHMDVRVVIEGSHA